MKALARFTSGFLAFGAAHAIEAARWTEWFHGQYRPWFLNSGRSVVFTGACLFVVGALVGLRSSRPWLHGLEVAAGAVAAMIAILFLAGDPGSIFPLVLAIGAAVIAMATLAGALAASALRPR